MTTTGDIQENFNFTKKKSFLLTDQLFENYRDLIKDVWREHKYQVDKWGIQTHTPFEWLTYTTEELGELAMAISEHAYRDGDIDGVINEAVQVATLSLKIAEMYQALKESQSIFTY